MRSLIAIPVAALIAIGCSAPAAITPTTAPAPTGSSAAAPSSAPNFDASTTLTIRTDGPWGDFDPNNSVNLPSSQISSGLYDRLVDLGPDGKLIPYLATSWEQTPTSLKFALRKDVTCNDGTPLTPTAVAKSFDRLLGVSDPKTRSTAVPGLFGDGPYRVSADDAAGTFMISLGTPFGDALISLTSLSFDTVVVCPKGLVPHASDDAAFGSGPYTIASEDRPNSITLKLRPDWTWGPGGRTSKGLPGTIVYKAIANETTATNLLVTGGLDIARIQGPDVQRLLADNRLGRLAQTPLYTNPMWMNPTAGHPTSDPKVREALATAVSADGWNQAAFGGRGEVTTSLFAKNAPCYEPATAQYIPSTDPAKAKSILLSAGYTADGAGKLRTKDGKPLTVQVVGDSSGQGAGPEYIANQLTQVGITVDFVNVDHTAWSSNFLQPGRWDVIVPTNATDLRGRYATSYFGADPPTGRNFSRIHDQAIDDLIKKAIQETGTQACADWSAVQIAWLKNYYVRPLSASNIYWFSRDQKWRFTASTLLMQPSTLN